MMNNTKFTKGKWSVLGEIVIAEKGHKTIKPLCSLNGRMDPKEDEANAHLIAAAPDMYETLKDSMVMLNAFHKNTGSLGARAQAEIIRVTLAKARGEL